MFNKINSFKKALTKDNIYSEIENMKNKIEKQIDKFNTKLIDIRLTKNELKDIENTMNNRVDKYENLKEKFDKLLD